MFNTLKLSFQIDFCYAINSVIYHLKKIPILKNLSNKNLYEMPNVKKVICFLSGIYSLFKLFLFRGIYFLIIYFLAKLISRDINYTFIHIYFVFSVIGMIINTYMMSISKKKYLCITLLRMDAKDFILSQYYYQSVVNFILNSMYLMIICSFLHISFWIVPLLSLFSFFSKTIGEAINIKYYKKNHVRLLTESLYFLVIIFGLVISILPFFNLYFYPKLILIVAIIFSFIASYEFYYLTHMNDYDTIYKGLNTYKTIMDYENEDMSTRQLMVNISDKDIQISEKKLKNKKGYDLFNTIFFERHRAILLRSAKLLGIVSSILIIIGIVILFEFPNYNQTIYKYLITNLPWIIFIMYFINRGAIITQAFFFNCDHAMLSYNFYKEPKVIVQLFKKRLTTLIKINLIPTLVIDIGLILILCIASKKILLDYLLIFIFIISISIFFSVHYLVIYYLLQPYSKDMKMKDFRYSIVQFLTYFCCYILTTIKVNPTLLCVFGILITVSYIIISLRLVYKRAYITFKIK